MATTSDSTTLPALRTAAHQRAVDLARLATRVPMPLQYVDLQRQLARAATAIALNLAEGVTRGGPGRYQIGVSLGSLAEVQSCLHIADYHDLDAEIVEVDGLIRALARERLVNPRGKGKGKGKAGVKRDRKAGRGKTPPSSPRRGR